MGNPNLSRMFHGTPESLNPGDIIKSPAARGLDNPRPDNPYYKHNRVYVSPLPSTAAIYAFKPGDTTESGPSGNIYEVEPVGRLLNDQEAIARHRIPGIAYHAREAKVIRKWNIDHTTGRMWTDDEDK